MLRSSYRVTARQALSSLVVLAMLAGLLTGVGAISGIPYLGDARIAQAQATQAQSRPVPGAFPDLQEHWAGPVVSLLVARGIVSGFADGLYHPARTLTRAEFAKLTVAGFAGDGAAQILADAGAAFPDLTGHWAKGWIAAGRELGLLRGYADGLFYPSVGMDRAQVTTVLVRALGWEAEATSLTPQVVAQMLTPYVDASTVPAWARPYLAIGAERGLIRGYEDGTLRATAPVSRAEAATFLARALDRLSLLYDIGGVLSEVEAGGSLVLSNIWGWSATPAAALRITTTSATAWLRNGLPVEPAALVPGDRIVAILGQPADGSDGLTAPALCVVSMSWDLYGDLVGLGPDGRTLTIRAAMQDVTLALGAETELFRHAEQATASALKLGDRIYALVDPLTGYAAIVDAVRPQAAGLITGNGIQDGVAYVDLVPSTGAPAEPQRHYLAANAKVFVHGIEAAPIALLPGLAILLAGDDRPDARITYCQAWQSSDDILGDTGAAANTTTQLSTEERATTASAPMMSWLLAEPSLAASPPPANAPSAVAVDPPGAVSRDGKAPGSDADPTPAASLPEILRPRAAQTWAWPADEGIGVSIRATGADQFWAQYGADGTGVKIAIIDTGVDVSHPLLQLTSSGNHKVVDWVDFTGEGRIDTLISATAHSGYISTRLGPVRLGSLLSRSGIYRSGVIDESKLYDDYGPGVDLDGNGQTDDRFAVVLVDSTTAGVYDRAIIDTNRDGDLRGEQPLAVYQDNGSWTQLSSVAAIGAGVVVADMDRSGYHVTLGFDGNGHGTHVAAIAAGHDASGWHEIAGMAPGATIMALKALGSDGSGAWTDILRAVEYAGARGANLVVLAVEAPARSDASQTDLNAIAAVAAQRGMLVFIAGGNSGPGVGTAVSSPDPELLIPVGGYMSGAMWSELLSYEASDAVWLYNSCGPAPGRSGLSPVFLAPAASVSAVPFSTSRTGFELFEGTSMAVPHAAGAAALLLDHARRTGHAPRPQALTRALADGANFVSGFAPAEQGFGAIDLIGAAQRLVATGGAGILQVSTTGGLGSIYDRQPGEALPTTWPLFLSNRGSAMMALSVETLRGTVTVPQEAVFVPAGRTREIRLQPTAGHVPGDTDLYDLVILRDLATGELVGQMLVHLPARHLIDPVGPPSILTGRVDPGRLERYYLQVPPGAATLDVTVALDLDATGGGWGIVQAYLYSPTGHLVADSGPIGQGMVDGAFTASLDSPPPGMWEVVVWGAPEADRTSAYTVIAQATSMRASVSPSLVQLGVAVGQPQHLTVTLTVEVANGAPALFVEVLGWMPAGAGPVTTYHYETIFGTASRVWSLPTLAQGTGLMEMTLTGLGPGDADLLLYYLQGGAQGQWLDAGSSRRVGVTAERLLLWQPDSGQYGAVAQGQQREQVLDVAFAMTRWPAGTMILDQGQPSAQGGEVRTLELRLPLPAAAGQYQAEVVIRDAATMVPITSASVTLERAQQTPISVLAPRLADVPANAAAGELAYPLIKVFARETLVAPADARIYHGDRTATVDRGALRLSEALLGMPPDGGGIELQVRAPGLATWHGAVSLPPAQLAAGVMGLDGEVSGTSPFIWPDSGVNLRAALRRKVSVLSKR